MLASWELQWKATCSRHIFSKKFQNMSPAVRSAELGLTPPSKVFFSALLGQCIFQIFFYNWVSFGGLERGWRNEGLSSLANRMARRNGSVRTLKNETCSSLFVLNVLAWAEASWGFHFGWASDLLEDYDLRLLAIDQVVQYFPGGMWLRSDLVRTNLPGYKKPGRLRPQRDLDMHWHRRFSEIW